MSGQHQYLVCSQRPGSPRVALEVCRICPKAKRCAAWRDFLCPPLFPGLDTQRTRTTNRLPRPAALVQATGAGQAWLPMAD